MSRGHRQIRVMPVRRRDSSEARLGVFRAVAALLLRCLAAGVLAAAPSRAVAADLYGLVIGINAYQPPLSPLDGAVNDAKDIAETLRRGQPRRLVVLLDQQATKAAIERTWKEFIGEAKAGDIIVFSYAGHGGQEPVPPGHTEEPDGQNQNFLLSGFQPIGAGFKERIVDDEINLWLKQADDKGIRVVFVADSCHSGGMNRSGGFGLKYRKAPPLPPPPPGQLVELVPPDIAALVPDDFKNVTFLAAVPRDRLAPEIVIDRQPRGALSWAFSRGLEGGADADNNGAITAEELRRYILQTVHQQVQSQQTPELLPLRGSREPVLPVIRKIVPEPNTPQALLRLQVVEGRLDRPLKVPGAAVVGDPGDADLKWNMRSGRVEHRVGGLVAEGITAQEIDAVVAKWAALAFLEKTAATRVASFDVTSGNKRYRRGERLEVALASARQPFLTIFNLPPNGRVEFFFPRPGSGERTQDLRGQTFRLPLDVRDPPFGAEHLVAILSDEPLDALHDELARMGNVDTAVRLPETLQRLLAGKRVSVGFANVYTCGDTASCARAEQ